MYGFQHPYGLGKAERLDYIRLNETGAALNQVVEYQVFQPKGKVILRHVAGEVLLVPVRGTVADMEKLYVLEGIGETAWNLIDGSRTLMDIELALELEFDASQEDLRRDLIEFIDSLKAAGLIEEKSNV
jgi:hypothetical protein